ncbi:MAG: TonB-dependent receptor [Bacteroidales bacterium]|nr:TonB-dependent receptor [Bacteroidales bacterium]
MKQTILLFLVALVSVNLFAQTGVIKGTVRDINTGETLIGVNVVYAPGKGTVTDIDGKYSLELDYGDYTLTISYVGYVTIDPSIVIKSNLIIMDFELNTVTLSEVEVVSDMAKTRETPVAFSTIDPVKIQEELASQDIPMILNSTPGVYATQQGGGDGDARINIRGFNQRNVAVMIDGIPVNDMENGWVYWSNWFGLDLVTQRIQVQRGLGSSKLALPSVGGTMNIITKGIQSKKQFRIKQEVGNNGFLRTSFGLSSGKLKGGWGITAAGSYKTGKGWVDRTFTEGWFYYLKVDKEFGKHIVSLSAMGAPQQHGQRRYPKPIATYDSSFAREVGVTETPGQYFYTRYIDTISMVDNGLRYNADWGSYVNENGEEITLNDKKNYYHKPQFTIRDFWNVSDKLYLSNILYLSMGNGGGTSTKNSIKPIQGDCTESGQINFQKFYDMNREKIKSFQYIRSNINNHFWFGLLSTANYQINDILTLSGGIDLRRYKGEHYEEAYDLLGGDYILDKGNSNRGIKEQLRVGDKINYHNDGIVQWGGLFGQLEYKKDNLSAFVNITGAYSGFKKIDYFKPRVLSVDDTTFKIGYDTVIEYNGVIYDRNSPGLEFQESDWKWIPGFTVKIGANYNISASSNIFLNMGYLSKAPRFNNVFDRYSIDLLREIENEFVKAFEVGYSLTKHKLAINANGYLTKWENKPGQPVSVPLSNEEIGYGNIQGMDAFHKGIEFDFAYVILPNLDLQGLFSLGDWRWTSEDSVRLYNDNNQYEKTEYFNAKGVHVGDAAQTQVGLSLRYEPLDDLYFSGRVTYFDRYYSDFNPFDLNPDTHPNSFDEDGNPVDSWETPDYFVVNLNAGYKFMLGNVQLALRASVINLLNESYISDARDNDSYSVITNSHDAKSAGVFFAMGRRFNTSLTISF